MLTHNPIADSTVTAGSAGRRRRANGEDGYILLAVLFMMVLVLLALSIAAPKVAADIERDREVELMHRGKQYTRAIKLYYKKFGAYPPSMDALEKSNEIRFLRRRYKDPVTGKDEWHLIHLGENKLPTAMGFFGQAMGGTGSGLNGSAGLGQSGLQGSTSAFGGINNTGPGSGGFLGSGSTPTSGTTDPGTTGGTTGSTGTTDPNAPSSGTTGTTGSTSAFGSSSGIGNGSGTNGGVGGNGQTFGGAGIIGVESTSPKLAILEYKKKKHFNEWEFVYDPAADLTTQSSSGGAAGGTPVGGTQIGNGPNGSQPITSPVTPPTQPTPPVQPTQPVSPN